MSSSDSEPLRQWLTALWYFWVTVTFVPNHTGTVRLGDGWCHCHVTWGNICHTVAMTPDVFDDHITMWLLLKLESYRLSGMMQWSVWHCCQTTTVLRSDWMLADCWQMLMFEAPVLTVVSDPVVQPLYHCVVCCLYIQLDITPNFFFFFGLLLQSFACISGLYSFQTLMAPPVGEIEYIGQTLNFNDLPVLIYS